MPESTYADSLYNWVSKADPTFTSRYTPADFKTKVQDKAYTDKLHDWIGKVDPTFNSRYDVNSFHTKLNPVTEEGFFSKAWGTVSGAFKAPTYTPITNKDYVNGVRRDYLKPVDLTNKSRVAEVENAVTKDQEDWEIEKARSTPDIQDKIPESLMQGVFQKYGLDSKVRTRGIPENDPGTLAYGLNQSGDDMADLLQEQQALKANKEASELIAMAGYEKSSDGKFVKSKNPQITPEQLRTRLSDLNRSLKNRLTEESNISKEMEAQKHSEAADKLRHEGPNELAAMYHLFKNAFPDNRQEDLPKLTDLEKTIGDIEAFGNQLETKEKLQPDIAVAQAGFIPPDTNIGDVQAMEKVNENIATSTEAYKNKYQRMLTDPKWVNEQIAAGIDQTYAVDDYSNKMAKNKLYDNHNIIVPSNPMGGALAATRTPGLTALEKATFFMKSVGPYKAFLESNIYDSKKQFEAINKQVTDLIGITKDKQLTEKGEEVLASLQGTKNLLAENLEAQQRALAAVDQSIKTNARLFIDSEGQKQYLNDVYARGRYGYAGMEALKTVTNISKGVYNLANTLTDISAGTQYKSIPFAEEASDYIPEDFQKSIEGALHYDVNASDKSFLSRFSVDPVGLFHTTLKVGIQSAILGGAGAATQGLGARAVAGVAKTLGRKYAVGLAAAEATGAVGAGTLSGALGAFGTGTAWGIDASLGFIAPSVLMMGDEMIKAELKKGRTLEEATYLGILRSGIEGLTERINPFEMRLIQGKVFSGAVRDLSQETMFKNLLLDAGLGKKAFNYLYGAGKASYATAETGFMETVEEEIGLFLNDQVTRGVQKKDATYKNDEPFNLDNIVNTALLTMATMAPQSLTAGAGAAKVAYQQHQEDLESVQYAKTAVAQSPELYRALVADALYKGTISKEQAAVAVERIDHLDDAFAGVSDKIKEITASTTMNEVDKKRAITELVNANLKLEDIARIDATTLTPEQQQENLTSLNNQAKLVQQLLEARVDRPSKRGLEIDYRNLTNDREYVERLDNYYSPENVNSSTNIANLTKTLADVDAQLEKINEMPESEQPARLQNRLTTISQNLKTRLKALETGEESTISKSNPSFIVIGDEYVPPVEAVPAPADTPEEVTAGEDEGVVAETPEPSIETSSTEEKPEETPVENVAIDELSDEERITSFDLTVEGIKKLVGTGIIQSPAGKFGVPKSDGTIEWFDSVKEARDFLATDGTANGAASNAVIPNVDELMKMHAEYAATKKKPMSFQRWLKSAASRKAQESLGNKPMEAPEPPIQHFARNIKSEANDMSDDDMRSANQNSFSETGAVARDKYGNIVRIDGNLTYLNDRIVSAHAALGTSTRQYEEVYNEGAYEIREKQNVLDHKFDPLLKPGSLTEGSTIVARINPAPNMDHLVEDAIKQMELNKRFLIEQGIPEEEIEADLKDPSTFIHIDMYEEGGEFPIGSVHVLSYINPSRVVPSTKDTPNNLANEYRALKALRKQILDNLVGRAELPMIVEGKSNGYFFTEKDGKVQSTGEAIKGSYQAPGMSKPVKIAQTIQVVKSVTTLNFGLTGQTINEARPGGAYIIIPTANGSLFAYNVNAKKASDAVIDSYINAIAVYQAYKAAMAKKDAGQIEMLKKLLDSEAFETYDLTTLTGLKRYLNNLIPSNQKTSDYTANFLNQSEAVRGAKFIDFNEATGIITFSNGRTLPEGFLEETGLIDLPDNNNYFQEAGIYRLDISKVDTNAEILLGEHLSQRRLATDFENFQAHKETTFQLPLIVATKWGTFEQAAESVAKQKFDSYKDYLLENTETPLLEHKIDDKSFAYFQQPTLRFAIDVEEIARLDEEFRAQQEKENEKPAPTEEEMKQWEEDEVAKEAEKKEEKTPEVPEDLVSLQKSMEELTGEKVDVSPLLEEKVETTSMDDFLDDLLEDEEDDIDPDKQSLINQTAEYASLNKFAHSYRREILNKYGIKVGGKTAYYVVSAEQQAKIDAYLKRAPGTKNVGVTKNGFTLQDDNEGVVTFKVVNGKGYIFIDIKEWRTDDGVTYPETVFHVKLPATLVYQGEEKEFLASLKAGAEAYEPSVQREIKKYLFKTKGVSALKAGNYLLTQLTYAILDEAKKQGKNISYEEYKNMSDEEKQKFVDSLGLVDVITGIIAEIKKFLDEVDVKKVKEEIIDLFKQEHLSENELESFKKILDVLPDSMLKLVILQMSPNGAAYFSRDDERNQLGKNIPTTLLNMRSLYESRRAYAMNVALRNMKDDGLITDEELGKANELIRDEVRRFVTDKKSFEKAGLVWNLKLSDRIKKSRILRKSLINGGKFDEYWNKATEDVTIEMAVKNKGIMNILGMMGTLSNINLVFTNIALSNAPTHRPDYVRDKNTVALHELGHALDFYLTTVQPEQRTKLIEFVDELILRPEFQDYIQRGLEIRGYDITDKKEILADLFAWAVGKAAGYDVTKGHLVSMDEFFNKETRLANAIFAQFFNVGMDIKVVDSATEEEKRAAFDDYFNSRKSEYGPKEDLAIIDWFRKLLNDLIKYITDNFGKYFKPITAESKGLETIFEEGSSSFNQEGGYDEKGNPIDDDIWGDNRPGVEAFQEKLDNIETLLHHIQKLVLDERNFDIEAIARSSSQSNFDYDLDSKLPTQAEVEERKTKCQ